MIPAAMVAPKIPVRPISGQPDSDHGRNGRESDRHDHRQPDPHKAADAQALQERDHAAAEQIGTDQQRHRFFIKVQPIANHQRYRHRARVHDQHML